MRPVLIMNASPIYLNLQLLRILLLACLHQEDVQAQSDE